MSIPIDAAFFAEVERLPKVGHPTTDHIRAKLNAMLEVLDKVDAETDESAGNAYFAVGFCRSACQWLLRDLPDVEEREDVVPCR